ncbi:MAG: aldehyde dehydrogenase family protein [Rhodospirillaceae bacterium]|jgi:aldehyde dehydrogenase (NAD+)|uniref:aldehyde dehydrogenase family protein n=1 Tax=Hwanghaeella sp. 1Z406 TaxID=3402811 RepID=UPI000C3CE040|nr:aldehyde dehydrogenase family protein [Rhodospirillales bacterium]MAX49138.1 aldehyde dehydrogenase family protein [Rhodospirillaceae bacterium]|tara:strand:- start:21525 stop:22976 length:1452 start_codon:yes stop_codon:yes gene_type:complete
MAETYNNLIGGEWVPGADPIANINPSDVTDTIGLYAQATAAQLDHAVAVAKDAQREWQKTGLEQRQQVLDAVGRELMDRSEELGRLLSREEGKPLAEGKGEVFRAGQFFCYYAAEVLRQIGETADSVRPGIEIDIRREPMGVVAVISPWNFPIATASWKIAPALAYGNAVIWKPANQTPASAWALAEILTRVGLPMGTFQLLMGPGAAIGNALVGHRDVDAVTFTGSYAVGRQVAAAVAGNLGKYQLELGSKNALLVMDDADLDLAVAAAVSGGYSGTGQKCTASSRLLVHSAVHDAFVDRLADALKSMKVGPALAPQTQMGPVVSDTQLAANLRWMGQIKQSGARIVYGGERITLEQDGFYMTPALISESTNDMPFNREEMFGPIAAVQRIESYEEGLAVANDTDYGLVAGIFTASLARATHFRRHIQTGCVTVNLPTAGTDYHVPFGGRKNSSSGPREQGRAAAEFYTQVKTAYIRAGEPE